MIEVEYLKTHKIWQVNHFVFIREQALEYLNWIMETVTDYYDMKMFTGDFYGITRWGFYQDYIEFKGVYRDLRFYKRFPVKAEEIDL